MCSNCDLRSWNQDLLLAPEEEKKRYDLHVNEASDPRYQNFVRPIFDFILGSVPVGSQGLDFGCGRSSALAAMLTQNGYSITLYDPYFFPDSKVLERTYDFVVASEVIEHLSSPGQEFQRLKGLLKSHAPLALMTHIYDDSIDFANWYYRRDPTHVVFYSKKTFDWIHRHFCLTPPLYPHDRVIVFKLAQDP